MVRKIAVLLIPLSLFFITLYILFLFLPGKAPKEVQKTSRFIAPGKLSQYSAFTRAPGSVFQTVVKRGSEIIYDQIYYNDDNLFRTPMPSKPEAENHAIFLGGSFTWGEGLPVEETLPFLFQEKLEGTQSYNLGFPGGGLHLLLFYFRHFNLKESIKEKRGDVYYVIIMNHLDRFLNRYNYLSYVWKDSPNYRVENGKVIFNGPIHQNSKYQKFHQAGALKEVLLRSEDQNVFSDKDLNDFSLGVKALEDFCKRDLSQTKFHVLIHPLGFTFDVKNRLIKNLMNQGIDVLDSSTDYQQYLKVNNLTNEDMVIKWDGHPNKKLNDFLSDWLVREFRKDDRSRGQ